jgi:hypothetical protein
MAHKIKRISARNYTCADYYIVYIPEIKLWNVGHTDADGNTHIEDFKKYGAAREYVLSQANKVGA